MKNVLILIIGLAIGAGGFWLVSSHRESEKPEHEKSAEEKSGPHDESIIKLDAKQQKAAGVETALPQPARLPEEVKGYGRVLDPAQVVTMTLDIQAAQATADASKKEFERLKTLYAQGQNASARSLETAEAAARRDETLLGLAEAKLRTTLGRTLMERKDFGQIIEALSKMEWLLARIDIVSGAPEKLPAQLRVAPLANESATISAELLGPAPVAETTIQGRGILVLIKTNSLAPNTALVGWIEIPDHDHTGVIVPATALLQEGVDTIVLVQASDETFKKTEIEVERMTDKGAFITEGLAATNRVVVSGAHQILSVTRAEGGD
jgi:hypothetical protein